MFVLVRWELMEWLPESIVMEFHLQSQKYDISTQLHLLNVQRGSYLANLME